jgi:hypothetical protein
VARNVPTVVHSLKVYYIISLFKMSTQSTVPAGGAAAAAAEGVPLAGPSAAPHLPVVGARNHVAVPCLAR